MRSSQTAVDIFKVKIKGQHHYLDVVQQLADLRGRLVLGLVLRGHPHLCGFLDDLLADLVYPGVDPGNLINGREYATDQGSGTEDDLEYACIFPLPQERDCSDPNRPGACDCSSLGFDKPGSDLGVALNGELAVHRIEKGRYETRRYKWPAACLTVNFSGNGRYIATGMADGSLHFWNRSTGKDSQMRGYATKVTFTEWSANSRFLATAAGNEVIVWDFGGKGPEGTHPLELKGHTERISALAFQPNGPWLVSAGRDWRISLWQPGKETVVVDAHLTAGEISAIRWSPDGQRLAVGESKGRVTLYDLVSRAAPAKRR